MSEKSSGRVRPISPREFGKAKELPDAVLEVFNQLIAEGYCGGRSRIMQSQAAGALVNKGLTVEEIFQMGWLDIMRTYRAAGWEVDFYRPEHNDLAESYFTFTPQVR